MLVGFLGSTAVAWIVTMGAGLSFWAILAAGQTAAWQLKWISIPLAVGVVWGGTRSLRTIRSAPAEFGGAPVARAGFSAAIVATLLVATLIGVTVPERLRRRQWALEAAENAPAYTLSRAMLQYRQLHGTLPASQEELVKELRTLPDPDGSIAAALQIVPPDGYEATTVLAAAAPKTKSLPRGAAIRDASLTTPEPPAVSFTNYELRLPGPDKKRNTDDDLIVRDGLVMTAAEFQDYKTRSSAP